LRVPLWIVIGLWQRKNLSDKLWALGCAHYGEYGQERKELARYRAWAKREAVDIAIIGDMFDIGLCFGTKHIGSIWNNDLSPQAQIDAACEDFYGLRKQIVAVVTGNHEKRADQLTDINPLRVMADRLHVPYYGASKVLRWNKRNVFVAHGASGSPMGDFNKVLNTYEGLDAVLLAHTHQLSSNRTRRFSVDGSGRQSERTIELARCGSFLKDAAYAKFALHSPTPIGSAILELQEDKTLKVRLGL
jgi:predicted phosphodiesterase